MQALVTLCGGSNGRAPWSVRGAARARLSLHLHNTMDDVELVLTAAR
jgi:hypothetical protein